jgi:hypothetical protein
MQPPEQPLSEMTQIQFSFAQYHCPHFTPTGKPSLRSPLSECGILRTTQSPGVNGVFISPGISAITVMPNRFVAAPGSALLRMRTSVPKGTLRRWL